MEELVLLSNFSSLIEIAATINLATVATIEYSDSFSSKLYRSVFQFPFRIEAKFYDFSLSIEEELKSSTSLLMIPGLIPAIPILTQLDVKLKDLNNRSIYDKKVLLEYSEDKLSSHTFKFSSLYLFLYSMVLLLIAPFQSITTLFPEIFILTLSITSIIFLFIYFSEDITISSGVIRSHYSEFFSNHPERKLRDSILRKTDFYPFFMNRFNFKHGYWFCILFLVFNIILAVFFSIVFHQNSNIMYPILFIAAKHISIVLALFLPFLNFILFVIKNFITVESLKIELNNIISEYNSDLTVLKQESRAILDTHGMSEVDVQDIYFN